MTITTTNRLIIRSFIPDDAKGLFDYLSHPRTPCFFDEKTNTLNDAENEVAKRSLDNSQYAIALKESNLLIGHLFADNADEPDPRTYCIGWHFNKKFEGQGFASEAVDALFDVLFTKKGARRLYAYVEDYNISSQKLCKRLGMREEGCFKEFVSFINKDGKEVFDNTLIYSILEKEWRSQNNK